MSFVVNTEYYAAADDKNSLSSALASFVWTFFLFFFMFLFVICTCVESVCLQQPCRQIPIKTQRCLLCKHSHWVQAAAQENISPQHSWLLSELRWFSAPVGTSCGFREGLCHFSLTPLHVILYHSVHGKNFTR